jgi:glutamyl-tRNA reductase
VIGAGQMARAVLPYLPGRPLWIGNRTRARAVDLLNDVGCCLSQANGVTVLPADPEAELSAWRQAANVIVCVPADPERDVLRVKTWNGSEVPARQLLHLGILSALGTPWADAADLTTLNDLFALQTANQDRRQLRFERARRACRERAQLRNLGGPVNLAHGWEDLSLFANIA